MRTLLLQRLSNFFIFQLQIGDLVCETASQKYFQNEVSWLMIDSEIREFADPLRVLQKTSEKQNEELILLTLAVPQT